MERAPGSASSRLPSRVSDPSKQPESRGMSPLGSKGDARASGVSVSSGSLAAGRGPWLVVLGVSGRGVQPSPGPRTALTVIVQEELGGRQQLGAVLGVRDVQLVQVRFPQLLEVLQGLVAVQQEGGRVFLGAGRGQG